jgi:hypothetical protein
MVDQWIRLLQKKPDMSSNKEGNSLALIDIPARIEILSTTIVAASNPTLH